MPQVWVDADALPRLIKDILVRAAWKRKVTQVFVANCWLQLPDYPTLSKVVVSKGFDAADDYIADRVSAKDLVICADIPLAARCIEKGGQVVTPRGRIIDSSNIASILGARDRREELRLSGVELGGPPPFKPTDVQKFANAFDRWVQRHH